MGTEFRQALSARRLAWAVGFPRHRRRQGHAAHAGRRALARRRASHVRRTKILSGQPPRRCRSRQWPRRSRSRRVCEQPHQQLQEELGLDHFEGRSWRGLHRPALMTMTAFALLQHLRLAASKKISPGPPQPTRAYRKPSSLPWRAFRTTDARIATGGSAYHSIECAKEVLGRPAHDPGRDDAIVL